MTYTTNHTSPVLTTHNWRTLTNSASYLLPYLTPSMQILDIGCGPGSMTIDFARRVPHGHVIGLEPVPEPLTHARNLASTESITNVTFQIGDIHSLPFGDNTFDLVHVHQVLQHIADPVQALREMRRVTKPNGIVAARESSKMSWYPEDNEGIRKWNELMERVGRGNGGNPNPGERIHVWAVEAGFEREKVRRSAGAWCFSELEERRYWGGRGSKWAEVVVEGGYATREELEGVVRGWEEWVGCEEGWFGVLHGEIVCWK
ncbi:S-adenosyl-L-methionine-dependent methyltransferase [Aspergillus sclerotioniger CBS 115572]|uniref:S-adenosyl-L-methionine-dependent methyltransferase n=1 Tax=Aspergillus sclerotioniger CBS 115572 TaxID=1450535 RepID=A0A317XAC1_9EURO|nr:S-adenosyl-L-methionine-dependent methyltransferase [Aspergillus sclerotioniger CBS 115572]PWY93878.1 S-adenosyl-L-methionine-dependent methyltransferase [Aspergillus sclerotioniger CBS 115572]